jgi:beta-lactamase class A
MGEGMRCGRRSRRWCGGMAGGSALRFSMMQGLAHRGDERFALCGTFKLLVPAFVLARVDRGEERLSRRVLYSRDGLVPHSPVTEKHAGEDRLTIAGICDAAVTLSDNTAGNLLLDSFGGPAGLTGYMRSLGDGVSRLDRQALRLLADMAERAEAGRGLRKTPHPPDRNSQLPPPTGRRSALSAGHGRAEASA